MSVNITLKEFYEFLLQYNEKNNKFPKLDEIGKKFNFKRSKVINVLRILEEKKLIKRSGSNYFFPKKNEKSSDSNEFSYIKIIFLKIIIFIIGLIASYMSIYYSYLWFLNMTNIFKAILLSLCVVGFNIIAFELIILFYKNKQIILSFLFVFLWIIILIFSMISTVAGQLSLEINKERKNQISSIKKNNEIVLFEEYENQIKDIKIDLESKRKERDKLLEFIAKVDYGKEYKNLNYRIYLKNQNIEQLKKELIIFQGKKEKLLINNLQINVTKKITFYDWLEKIFKINKNVFQFILQIFPAIFLDIISPLSFGIILFYQKL